MLVCTEASLQHLDVGCAILHDIHTAPQASAAPSTQTSQAMYIGAQGMQASIVVTSFISRYACPHSSTLLHRASSANTHVDCQRAVSCIADA